MFSKCEKYDDTKSDLANIIQTIWNRYNLF